MSLTLGTRLGFYACPTGVEKEQLDVARASDVNDHAVDAQPERVGRIR
jgi:hypothetical protein